LQIILSELRNQWNSIIFSRIEIQSNEQQSRLYDDQVIFDVSRVYPKVQTPNGRDMYLPRIHLAIFRKGCGCLSTNSTKSIYKFGLAAGYVGSFHYQLLWNNESYEGTGYCEYIDCRPLHWQKNKTEQIIDQIAHFQPYLCKK
jgi:hypothetical protein